VRRLGPLPGLESGQVVRDQAARRGSRRWHLHFASDQAPKPPELEHGFAGFAGGGEVDVEFGDPVVGFGGIDEHLLDAPGALVVGGRDVGVADVAGFGVDGNRRLTLSLKDLHEDNRSYVQLSGGERLRLPLRDLPIVKL
jgi:hypothetical protein